MRLTRLSSESVSAAPASFLETAVREKKKNRKREREKEGNKVEGWIYLFALGQDYQQCKVSLPYLSTAMKTQLRVVL